MHQQAKKSMLCDAFLFICLPILEPELNQVPGIYPRTIHILSVVEKTKEGEESADELLPSLKLLLRFLTVAI